MSLEENIATLTAAVNANTEALYALLNAPKSAPACSAAVDTSTEEVSAVEETSKKKKAPKPPQKSQEDVTPAVEPEPEPEAQPEPETTPEPAADIEIDEEAVLKEITETVKQKILSSKKDPARTKAEWMTIREKFGVGVISELKGQPAKILEALALARMLTVN